MPKQDPTKVRVVEFTTNPTEDQIAAWRSHPRNSFVCTATPTTLNTPFGSMSLVDMIKGRKRNTAWVAHSANTTLLETAEGWVMRGDFVFMSERKASALKTTRQRTQTARRKARQAKLKTDFAEGPYMRLEVTLAPDAVAGLALRPGCTEQARLRGSWVDLKPHGMIKLTEHCGNETDELKDARLKRTEGGAWVLWGFCPDYVAAREEANKRVEPVNRLYVLKPDCSHTLRRGPVSAARVRGTKIEIPTVGVVPMERSTGEHYDMLEPVLRCMSGDWVLIGKKPIKAEAAKALTPSDPLAPNLTNSRSRQYMRRGN